MTTAAEEDLGAGDLVTIRRKDRDLDVANRDTWIVIAVGGDGALEMNGSRGRRTLPAVDYAFTHVELAYATTVHGARGRTVDAAHLAIGHGTGAAPAYVGMTRGRHSNVAHMVAPDRDQARAQWIRVFTADRADQGPRRAATVAVDDIEVWPAQAPPRYADRALYADGPSPRTSRPAVTQLERTGQQ